MKQKMLRQMPSGSVWRGLVCAAIALFILQPIPAAAEAINGSAARFLLMGPGSRPVAMGKAYTAIADGVNALYWNPAGLARASVSEVQFMHGEWFGGIDYDYLAYAHEPELLGGRLGANVTLVDFGAINVTRISGENAIVSLGTATARDLEAGVTYARTGSLFDYGVSVKYIQEQIETVRAQTSAIDLGLLWHTTPIENVRVGAALLNLGPRMTYIQESENLPLAFKFGVAYLHPDDLFTLSGDLIKSVDNALTYHVGGEFKPTEVIALRLGYNSENEGGIGITGGIGFDFHRGFTVDYAYVPYGDLGNTHRLSLNYIVGFNDRKAREPASSPARPRPPVTREIPRVAPRLTAADHLAAGHRQYQDGDHAAAVASYQRALESEPDNVAALEGLALAHYQTLDFRAAADDFRRLLKRNPANVNAHLYLGVCYEQQGRIPEAVTEWERTLELEPDNRSARARLDHYRPPAIPPEAAAPAAPAAAETVAVVVTPPAAVVTPAPTVASWLTAGHQHYQDGDYAAAAADYTRALALEPDNATALESLAITHYQRRDFRAAADDFRRLLKRNPANAKAHLYLGVCYEQQGRIPEAVAEWERTLELEPGNQSARARLDHYRPPATPPEAAVPAASAAAETVAVVVTPPAAVATTAPMVASWLAAGHQHYQDGNYAAAAADYTRALALEPDNATALESLAITHFQMQDFRAAGDGYRRILATDPANATAHLYLGVCYEQQGRIPEAVAEWERTLELEPGNQSARARYDYYRPRVTAPAAAVPAASAAAETVAVVVTPPAAVATTAPMVASWLAAGHQHYQDGNYAAAAADYTRALALEPDNATALESLAITHYQMHDFRAAGDGYRRILATDPANATAHLYLGVCYEQQGRIPEAVAEWERTLELEPGNQSARARYDYYRPRVTAPAAPVRETPSAPITAGEGAAAAETAVSDQEYQRRLDAGEEFYNQGKFQEALEILRQAAELRPNDQAVHYLLSDVYYRLSDFASAIREIELAQQAIR